MPLWALGVLLLVVMPAVVAGAQLLVRRLWPGLREGTHNEAAGFLFSVVGVIYAVLLAFVVIVTWQNFTSAKQVVGQEASALLAIERGADVFGADARAKLREDERSYISAVIEREWPSMARGGGGDPVVAGVLNRLSRDLIEVPAVTTVQQQYVGTEADRFNDLVSHRSQRLDFVEQGVPPVLWVALGIGALVTIGFSLTFGVHSTALHVGMSTGLAVMIGVLLVVTLAIEHPFTGDVAVTPSPLQKVLVEFDAPS
jgi:hypothetical protein